MDGNEEALASEDARLRVEMDEALAERERSEEAARRLAAIVESSDDAIISKNLDGIILTWNRGAERLFGYTAPEIIGRSVLVLIPTDRHNEEPGILGRIRRGERIDHYETIRQRKDGSLIDISLTVSPILNRKGEIVGASKIARDISERKRAEEILHRQYQIASDESRRKNEFRAMLGHELRNPLAAIQNAATLLDDADNGASIQWATGVVRRQTALLSRLVDDLLDVARINHGRIELRNETLDLRTIVRQAIETAQPLVKERQHTLDVSLPENPLLVVGDAARIEQLLVNLLTNAAKYTDPGGRIWVSAKHCETAAIVWIKDNGIGISQDLISGIFDLFVQAPRSLDRSRGGLGLGLALARRLAEMHGGSLTARSEGTGKGSEFALTLPLAVEESAHGSAGPSSVAKPPAPLIERLLMVDDNRDSTYGMRKLLERRGYQVEVAFDGSEALQKAQAFQPKAFLLDLGLPDMNGFTLAEELRKIGFGEALFIAISGFAQQQDFEISKRAGFQYHFAKPVDLEKILDALTHGKVGTLKTW